MVIDDAWPWYESSTARGKALRQRCQTLGCRYLDEADVVDLAVRMLRRTLRADDVVVVPLMSGALVFRALELVRKELAIQVVIAPLSKHPFVTLSADSELDLRATCREYEQLSILFMTTKLRTFLSQQPRRLVLLDSSSAAGSDARLFFDRVASWGWGSVETVFAVLVEAVGADDHFAPGPSRELKTCRPDAAALTAVGFDVVYTSHLRFLSRPFDYQATSTERLRAEFPMLTSYWDASGGDTAGVSSRLARTRANSAHRTHARTARSTQDIADQLTSAVVGVENRLPLHISDRAWALRRTLIGSLSNAIVGY